MAGAKLENRLVNGKQELSKLLLYNFVKYQAVDAKNKTEHTNKTLSILFLSVNFIFKYET